MEKLNIMYLDYDYENDILFFFQKNNKDYEFSDALNESIIIDYNKDRQPMGLEIFNASKLF